jgi:hypothetical protein
MAGTCRPIGENTRVLGRVEVGVLLLVVVDALADATAEVEGDVAVDAAADDDPPLLDELQAAMTSAAAPTATADRARLPRRLRVLTEVLLRVGERTFTS